MNEKQLKQLADLLKSFGFNVTKVEQNITKFDNTSSKGQVSIGYHSHFTYSPGIKLEE